MFSSIVDVLVYIESNGSESTQRSQARGLLDAMTSFDFVFYLHLMLDLFALTHSLSMALQKQDQDILEAVVAVSSVKSEL